MPNSLLWIGLVVLWVFVLFPMLAGKRPRVRRINDSALETRVLHRGGDARVVARGAKGRQDEALSDAQQWEEAQLRDDYVPDRRGRGGYDPEADRLARAARYRFRQRATLALALVTAICFAVGLVINPLVWCGSVGAATILAGYLVYLRRQVRIEEEIRRRRTARLGRGRVEARAHPEDRAQGEDDHEDRVEYPKRPERFRRVGGTVLELDDEDPIFDHLDHYDADSIRDEPDHHAHELRRVVGE